MRKLLDASGGRELTKRHLVPRRHPPDPPPDTISEIPEPLRQNQRLIAPVAETSPAILYVYDLLKGSFVYVNNQVYNILGFTADEFIRRGFAPHRDLAHPDDVGVLVDRERQLGDLEDGTVAECLFRMKNIRSEWLWFRTRETIFTRTPDGRAEQIIGTAEDVTQRRLAQEELERSQRQLRALSARLQDVREAERAAVARRVHDELGQGLSALSMDLTFMRRYISESLEQRHPIMADKVAEMTELIASMLQTVRTVASELRPPVLDEFGLLAAIEWQAGEFEKKYGTRCDVSGGWHTEFRSQQVETAVFRIFQEALTNVARHARGQQDRRRACGRRFRLILAIRDNGRGITRTQQSQSLGILGMRERALLFGGTVAIVGVPAKGTTVTVTIPRRTIGGALAPRKETLL
jgi:PAS domain S-box-containing protein